MSGPSLFCLFPKDFSFISDSLKAAALSRPHHLSPSPSSFNGLLAINSNLASSGGKLVTSPTTPRRCQSAKLDNHNANRPRHNRSVTTVHELRVNTALRETDTTNHLITDFERMPPARRGVTRDELHSADGARRKKRRVVTVRYVEYSATPHFRKNLQVRFHSRHIHII